MCMETRGRWGRWSWGFTGRSSQWKPAGPLRAPPVSGATPTGDGLSLRQGTTSQSPLWSAPRQRPPLPPAAERWPSQSGMPDCEGISHMVNTILRLMRARWVGEDGTTTEFL